MWYIHAGSLGYHCSTWRAWVQARELVYIGQTVSLAFQRETANMAEIPEANSTHDYPPVVCLIGCMLWACCKCLMRVPNKHAFALQAGKRHLPRQLGRRLREGNALSITVGRGSVAYLLVVISSSRSTGPGWGLAMLIE